MNTIAGMLSRLSRCTPIERPMRKHISTIHLPECGSSASSYQRVMAQNTTAVNNDDMAYTSASTAENQKVSLKQYANAPTAPAPHMDITSALVISSPLRKTILFAKNTIVR